MSRRALFGAAAATAAAGTGGYLLGGGAPDDPPAPSQHPPAAVAPDGVHQTGITTEQQRHMTLAAFDLPQPGRAQLAELMGRWSGLTAALVQGDPGPPRPNRDVADSGVADDLGPERLTLTFGFGRRIFTDPTVAGRAPARLADLPAFAGDRLDAQWTGGDVVVQVCADDPTVVAHALRELRARVPGIATVRWVHQGFLTAAGSGRTPRNLFGQPDGTANLRPGSPEFDAAVWAGADEPSWLQGGTYLVFRKIRMLTPMWDLSSAAEQNAAVGRDRHTGAPLSGGAEHTALDLTATGADGNLLIARDAHVRLANQAERMFRRSYNYDNGLAIPAGAGVPDEGHHHPPGTSEHDDQGTVGMGSWDSGLLFLAYVRDPATQYVPLQDVLARQDRLHTFLRHTGSALFAVPGFTPDERYPGERLLA